MPDHDRTSRQLIDSIRTVKTDHGATPAPDQPPPGQSTDRPTDRPTGTSPAAVTADTGHGTGARPGIRPTSTQRSRQPAGAATGKTRPAAARAASGSIVAVDRTPPQFGATDPAYQSRRRIWPD